MPVADKHRVVVLLFCFCFFGVIFFTCPRWMMLWTRNPFYYIYILIPVSQLLQAASGPQVITIQYRKWRKMGKEREREREEKKVTYIIVSGMKMKNVDLISSLLIVRRTVEKITSWSVPISFALASYFISIRSRWELFLSLLLKNRKRGVELRTKTQSI